MERDMYLKEYENKSLEELERLYNETLAYKNSPQIWDDAKAKGQEIVTDTNMKLHTLRLLLNNKRKTNLTNELNAMLQEYATDDKEENITQSK